MYIFWRGVFIDSLKPTYGLLRGPWILVVNQPYPATERPTWQTKSQSESHLMNVDLEYKALDKSNGYF